MSNFFDSSGPRIYEKSHAPEPQEMHETKEIQRGTKVVDCIGALATVGTGPEGPLAHGSEAIGRGEWGITSLVYYSLEPPLKSGSDYKLSLNHTHPGDAILRLIYFGKGKVNLMIGANHCYFSPWGHWLSTIWMTPCHSVHLLVNSGTPHIEVCGGDPSDRVVWCEILCDTANRERLQELSKETHTLPSNHPVFQSRLLAPMLDCVPHFIDFEPAYSQGILTVDFGKDFGKEYGKESNNAIDSLAFRPHQVPFSFRINSVCRIHINETILKAIMAQTLAPFANYDPVLDVCFLRIGPMHMGHESIMFRKESL
jgi:hypothetical protein